MSKHTKGEWYSNIVRGKHKEPTEIKVLSNIAGRTLIADLMPSTIGLNIDEEAEANAKLIAAAPDLLEAAIEITEKIAAKELTSLNDTITKLLSAINKATK